MQYIKLIVTIALCASAHVWADVAMITQVTGEATLTLGSRTQAAVPFVKVNTGDKLVLSSGARVQLVYFGSGRQEVWKGDGQIEVGSQASKSELKPEVSQLPPLVAIQIAKMPDSRQLGTIGMVRMRAMDAAAELDKQYGDLKRSVPADDTTPEVYLLSGLIDLKDFRRARSVLAELNGKAGYKPVVDYFLPLVNARGK